MKVTRITEENAVYFSNLCPDELLLDERTLKLGALTEEDEPVSICVTDVSDGMAWIRWIFTDPDQRNRGGAALLTGELLRLLDDLDIKGIMADFHADDEGLEDFFMENDFLVGDENTLFRIPLMDLLYGVRLEEVVARRSRENRAYSLQDTRVLKPLVHFLKTNGVEAEFIEGISREYSFVVMDPSDTVTEGIFVSESENGDLHINYLVGEGSPQGIVDLVAALYDALIEKERDKGNLVFSDRLGAGISFVEMLTGNEVDSYRVPGLKSAVKRFR